MTETAVARSHLAAVAQRSAELIGSLDADLPVSRSEWTVGGTATHLIVALKGFTQSARGEYDEWSRWEERIPNARMPERVQALNRAMLADEPKVTSAESAQAIIDGTSAFLAATADVAPQQFMLTPWYGEQESMTVGDATCLLFGEQIMHCYDIARSAGRKWSISGEDAVVIFDAVQAMLPRLAVPDRIGDLAAAYEFRLGKASRFVVRLADGAATVEPATGQRVDCHVLADPVALLLLGYGRTNQWQAIGRAKMITWGTKPWLAFRFPSFFDHP
jgi:hypothetical protein